MPRRPRIAFPGYPHHIVQRGHSRLAVFFCDSDRLDYLASLAECRQTLALKVYAYCLMTNHVHLLIDPGSDARNLSALMKCLAGRHSRRMNRVLERSGSMWEGRFHCSPIETDRYLLTCGRYIDLNPVRAALVSRPEDFKWSSYRARAGIEECGWLDPDPALMNLASSPERRFEIYRSLAAVAASDEDLEFIRGALQRNQLTGSSSISTEIKRSSGIEVSRRARGRPAKESAAK